MTDKKLSSKAVSVLARLKNFAKQQGLDLNYVIQRYVNERVLYRLSISEYTNEYILKGATLLFLWLDQPYRPTKDMDFLGCGDNSPEHLFSVFTNVLQIPSDDSVELDVSTLQAERIKDEQAYEGVRVTCKGLLGSARISVQMDVGFGDAVHVGNKQEIPCLIDAPAPLLLIYPMESVVAEKFEAAVSIGLSNSRMKDFSDILTLSKTHAFDGVKLSSAIAATFKRRRTQIPSDVPTALSEDFLDNEDKIKQWQAFKKRTTLAGELRLSDVGTQLKHFILPPTHAASSGQPFVKVWSPSGPSWHDS